MCIVLHIKPDMTRRYRVHFGYCVNLILILLIYYSKLKVIILMCALTYYNTQDDTYKKSNIISLNCCLLKKT